MKIDLTKIDYILAQADALKEYRIIKDEGVRHLKIFKRFCEMKNEREELKYADVITLVSDEYEVSEPTVRRSLGFLSSRFPEIIGDLRLNNFKKR